MERGGSKWRCRGCREKDRSRMEGKEREKRRGEARMKIWTKRKQKSKKKLII